MTRSPIIALVVFISMVAFSLGYLAGQVDAPESLPPATQDDCGEAPTYSLNATGPWELRLTTKCHGYNVTQDIHGWGSHSNE